MEIKPLILVVEDEKAISKFIKVSLETQDYKCIETTFGKEAISLVLSHNPDVVILDLGLPDMDGIKVIPAIKEMSNSKIIVVSARGHERDKVEALDGGADDYLTKPFSVAELLARVRVALRNKNQHMPETETSSFYFSVKDLIIDSSKRKVLLNNEDIHLTPIEYKLIELLAKYAGRVLTHKFIIESIWGNTYSDTQSLRVFMANLRRKLEIDTTQPQYIITEVGVGYRMIDE